MNARRTPSERLLERLTAMGIEIAPGARIERTYAGYWQRRQGAWVWRMIPADGGAWVGSLYPVTTLVGLPRLGASLSTLAAEWSVFPYEEGHRLEPGDLVEPA